MIQIGQTYARALLSKFYTPILALTGTYRSRAAKLPFPHFSHPSIRMPLNSAPSEEMRTNPWFSSLTAAEQQALLIGCEVLELGSGKFLFRQGDLPDGFYGLNGGRLKATTVREDGREAILAVIEPGNWFGQTSMAANVPRARDVVALEDSRIFAVKPEAFDALMKNHNFVIAIARLQSMHLNLLYRMIEDATLHSTQARVARRLVLLAYGDLTMASKNRREVTVSQDTLAMMVGVTRQTLALELRAFATQGAIALRYGRIEILSKKILLTFCENL